MREKPFAKFDGGEGKLFELISTCEVSDTTKKNWKEAKIIPLERLVEDDIGSIENIQCVTDYMDSAVFRLPDDPVSPELAYLIGLAAGDGGFSSDNLWTLVDGGAGEELQHSERFLRKISDKIEKTFGVNTGIRKRENRFELYISNKWFCRFLRNFYGLPRSYKKGKLSKPEMFNKKGLVENFWRGVFDSDGAIVKRSNRISLSSATRSFLEECKQDFKELGIEVYEIRKPAAYLLRLQPGQLPVFARKIGFSHPRKKKLLIEKLEKGSRSYSYQGRTGNYIGDFYDLTEIEKLRVLDAGEKIKEYREENDLYQRELASKLDVSDNQIYYWENNEYAVPISILENFFESKKALLDHLLEKENRFKYGKRGNQESSVILPKRKAQKIDVIAENCTATSNELRIKSGHREISEKVKQIFSVKVREKKNKLIVDNLAVYNFFSTFYHYNKKFRPWEKEEIRHLKKKLEI